MAELGPQAASNPEGSREERLGAILAEWSDLLNKGQSLDVEKVLAAHPDLAEDLAAALSTLQRIPPETGRSAQPAQLGDYRLIRAMGRGGMGVVYEAWQVSMDRRVALKVLPPGIAADSKTFTRFMREARTAGRLHHQNIVPVHAMGIEGNTPYYAMEYVEGATLAQVVEAVRRRGEGDRAPRRDEGGTTSAPFPLRAPAPPPPLELTAESLANPPVPVLPPLAGPPETLEEEHLTQVYFFHVAEAFAGVAEGLHHAHAAGVIHRDLKPSNLILDREGRLRILDFGLAHLEGQESLTRSGEFLGSVLYVSPEQARARRTPIDHRSDIYSLGATLFEALALRPPFRGKDSHDTLSQIISCDPPSPRRFDARIPRDLETIVLKCLRKDPSDRYGTAEALAQDLRRFVRGDPVEARPQPALSRWYRRFVRYRVALGLGSLLCLLAVTSGLLVNVYAAKRRVAAEQAYRAKVLESAMLLELAEMTASAGMAGAGAIDPQDLVATGDFLALLPEGSPHPVDMALEKLEQAKAVAPSRPEAYYHAARGLKLLGNDEKALAEVRAVRERAPAFVPAEILERELASGMARSLATPGAGAPHSEQASSASPSPSPPPGSTFWELWRSAHEAAQEREWGRAAQLYQRLLRESRGTEGYLGSLVEFHLGRGRALLESGDCLGAVESFVTARTLWPEAKIPQLLLGKAYLAKGERNKAEETFQALCEDAGDLRDEVVLWVAALWKYSYEYERGLVWAGKLNEEALRLRLQTDFNVLLGRQAEAIRLGRAAIERDPTDGRAHHFLAVALLRDTSTVREALDVARRAWELDGRDVDTLCLYASACQFNGKFEEAESLFRQAIQMAPDEPRGHDHLARLFWHTRRFDEAEEHYRRAVGIFEENPHHHVLNSYSNLADLLVARGKFDEAMTWYERAGTANKRAARPLVDLGSLQRKLGRPGEAEATLRRLLERYPKEPLLHRELGRLAWIAGDRARAAAAFNDALSLDPGFQVAAIDLALLLEEQGRYEGSFELYLDLLRRGTDPAKKTGSNRSTCENLIALHFRRGRDGSFARLWDKVVELLESRDDFVREKPGLVALLALALAQGRDRKDPARALDCAASAVDKTRRREPELLAILGEALATLGREEEAVLAIEEALRLPRASRVVGLALADHRARALPRLASYASVEAELGGRAPGSPEEQELLSRFRAAAERDRDRAVLAYLEGMILERAKRHEDAAARFREALAIGGPDAGVVGRIADCLRLAGDAAGAARELGQALGGGLAASADLWNQWVAIELNDLAQSPAAAFDALPPGPDPSSGVGAAAACRSDCAWLLDRLAATKGLRADPLRINCGGRQLQDRETRTWSDDRFYRGGTSRGPCFFEISGDDGRLYQWSRSLSPAETPGGYRIPLPSGRYRVTLHAAETWIADYFPRRTEVRCEAAPVLTGYAPSGLGVADVRPFEVEVADGILDLEFLPEREPAVIAGLEIARVD